MLTHGQIWQAIDALAAKHDLSASGLAKAAGLDPTTFNKSKRLTPDGRQRWPSTESVAKVLIATGETLDDFVSLVGRPRQSLGQTIPFASLEDASVVARFDSEGLPASTGWDELEIPVLDGTTAFALEISGDRFLPVYRDGDVLIVSTTEPVRRGDRLMVRLISGGVHIGTLRRETARTLEIQPFSAQEDVVLERRQIARHYRILFVRH